MPRGPFKGGQLYGITRRRYGWVVRLTRNARRHERSFSDRAFGGEREALAHATRWRDELIRQHPPEPRRQRSQRERGGSGPVPGVTPELDRRGRIRLWRAKTYLGPGQVLQKTFSLARYGGEALQRALDERERQLQCLQGRAWVHPEEARLRVSTAVPKPLPAVPARVPPAQVRRSSNTSGVPGVVRRARHWTAQTTIGGRWVSQSFRVDHHGEEVAFILALWARHEQLQATPVREP